MTIYISKPMYMATKSLVLDSNNNNNNNNGSVTFTFAKFLLRHVINYI